MLKRAWQIWRAHPVLVAAAAGAMVGAANAILIEARGLWLGKPIGVLPLLFPPADGLRGGQTDAIQTALLLLIEFAGNLVGFSLLFAVPVALFVGMRGLLTRPEKSGLS